MAVRAELVASAFDQMVALLEAETDRLKANLALLRESTNPARDKLLRGLVAQIDQREDRLSELRALQQSLAADDGNGAP